MRTHRMILHCEFLRELVGDVLQLELGYKPRKRKMWGPGNIG